MIDIKKKRSKKKQNKIRHNEKTKEIIKKQEKLNNLKIDQKI